MPVAIVAAHLFISRFPYFIWPDWARQHRRPLTYDDGGLLLGSGAAQSPLRRLMNMKIERPAIVDVEDARLGMALERMRRVARKLM